VATFWWPILLENMSLVSFWSRATPKRREKRRCSLLMPAFRRASREGLEARVVGWADGLKFPSGKSVSLLELLLPSFEAATTDLETVLHRVDESPFSSAQMANSLTSVLWCLKTMV